MCKGHSLTTQIKQCDCYIPQTVVESRHSIIVPTVAYASETWVWNQSQRSKIQAVEMSYLRGGCGVNRMDGESNENVYRKFWYVQ